MLLMNVLIKQEKLWHFILVSEVFAFKKIINEQFIINNLINFSLD